MTQKIEICGKKYAHFGCFEGLNWTNLGGRKSRFVDFFELFFIVVWEVFGHRF